ncbi:hypothetical protein EDB89DRAFT_1904801 [Lactarius sanguifluus]|nr:hypothetical protein EDB89DRAFT_1904801 [Lactarius sanguifluus]
MSSQLSRKFAFAKMGLLGLRPRLEEDFGDAAAADELAQTFSVALAAADAGLDIAVDPEVTALLSLARDRLLPHASVAWLEHSPHLVAGREEALRSSVIAGAARPVGCSRWLRAARRVPAAGGGRYYVSRRVRGPSLCHPYGRSGAWPSVVFGGLFPVASAVNGAPSRRRERFSCQGYYRSCFRIRRSSLPLCVRRLRLRRHLRWLLRRPRSPPPPLLLGRGPVAPLLSLVLPRIRFLLTESSCGRDFPLMDVAQIPGYIRVLSCLTISASDLRRFASVRRASSARSSVRPLSARCQPYSCSHCVSAGRECLRPAAGRARGRTGAAGPSAAGPSAAGLSGAAASSSLRLPASAFFGPEVPTSGVALAATVMFWRGEVARNLAARRALDVQLSFAEWQYAHFLGALVEPDPTTSQPPRKRARTGASRGRSGKGKEKAIDVDALSDGAGNAEAMDDAADGAGAGADGVDETSWAGFSANFGME